MSIPASKAWRKYMVGNYAPQGTVFAGGKGSTLYDRQGNKYIDFASGVAVSSLGHGDKALTKAITDQAGRLMHLSNLFVHERTVRVARKLVKATRMDRVYFCNSGAEANECALKIARKRGSAISGRKFKVISFTGSFHGRVGMSLAACGQKHLWEEFGPQPPGFVHVPIGDDKALRDAFSDEVCAAIVEPIQGESGVIVVPKATLSLLGRLCAKHDALLVMDEIQTGMGRTGKMLASTYMGLRPDIITLGKGMGGGFPVAATLVANKAVDVLKPGDHGTTYGGNALALAAVDTVLGRINNRRFLARVTSRGKALMSSLSELRRGGAPIAGLRGKGLMIGIVLDTKRATPQQVAAMAMDEGLLVIPTVKDVVRVMPPLTVTQAEMKSGISRLRRTFKNL